MTADRPSATTLAQLLRRSAAELQAEPVPAFRAAAPARGGPIPAGLAPQTGRATTAGEPRWLWRLARAGSWAGAAACVLLLVGSAWLMFGPQHPARTVVDLNPRASDFLPLLPVDRWSSAGAEASPAWVVSAEMPTERLAAMGLPYDPGRAGETVRAELLVRATGEVLAVRFVR